MLVKLLKSTKYKKKMLLPGTHDVIQKSAKEWIKLGIAVMVKDEKKVSSTVQTSVPIESENKVQVENEASTNNSDTPEINLDLDE